MPRRTPYPKVASTLGHSISKNNHSLLWQPERCLQAPSSIVKSNEASWKHHIGFDHLQLVLRQVVGPEEPRTESTNPVATDKLVYVPNVVRNNDSGHRWWPVV